MIARVLGDRRGTAVLRRIDRPGVIVLAVLLAAMATVAWLGSPLWMAVAIGGQLLVGGLGTVRLLGPAQPGIGYARYAVPTLGAVALSLFGRILPGGVVLLFAPLAAILIWSILWLELRASRGIPARTLLDLALVSILFASASGIVAFTGRGAWPPPIALTLPVILILTVRAAEARGRTGVAGIGQGLLHTLAVSQVAVVAVLLELPGVVAPALLALAFHAWSGAAEALEEGASGRAVLVEFGSLAVLGIVVAVLLDAT
ncbi:MAG: hypothetical protein ABI622_04685 [Chloroflexota bacterium]